MNKLSYYLRLPEMNSFWFLSVLLLVIAVISIYFMPALWGLPVVAGLIIVAVSIFSANLKMALLNLGTRMDKVELLSIIANLEDGVIAYSPDFKILIFNKAAGNIFNVKSEDLVGQTINPRQAQTEKLRQLIQVFYPTHAPVAITRSGSGDYPQIMDLSLTKPVLELRVTTAKISDNQNRLIGFVKIVHDRTRELRVLASKTEFISVAAHQLRTPITAINWASETLVKDAAKLNDDQNEMVSVIVQSSKKLLNMVDDLLNVAKMEEGRFGYNFSELDLVSFIAEFLDSTREQVRQYGVKIYFDRPQEQKIPIYADKGKLTMALSNLIDNAVRYNVKNGEVIVKAERVKGQPFVGVSVKDTGIGIAEEDMNKLFSKFFRAKNAERAQVEGSGLGLFIVKNIIERHGGKISVASTVGRGTTFYFTLPTDPNLVPKREMIYSE